MFSHARFALKLFLCCGLLALLSLSNLYAASVLSWTGGSFPQSAYQQTVGWNFTVNTALTVASLQWYDPTGTNVLQHTVDVWNMSGTLQGTACVGSGCAGSSWSAGYWSTPVGFALATGTYDIGGWVDVGDPFEWYGATVTTDPAITFIQPVFFHGPVTQFPGTTTCCGSIGFFGPNFTTGSVPEPGSLGLLASGLVTAVGMLRRKRPE